MEEIIIFLRSNAPVFVAVSSVMAIIAFVFYPFRAFYAARRRPDKVEIANPEALNARGPTAAPSQPVITLTLAQFEEKLYARETDIRARLEHSHAQERTLLKNQLEELFRQKADPQKAMAESHARIQDLEARLQRMGNELGGAELVEAQAALAKGDATLADGLFAKVEQREASAVQSAARAAFARGEIAEGEIRWADAAEHYARAANLDATVESQFKAHEFRWRAGDYPQAVRLGEALVVMVRAQGDKQALSKALNAHATVLNLTGKHGESEALYHEILALDRVTIGTKHREYSKHVNNLAHIYLVTDRLDKAEPLFREARDVAREAVGEDHPTYAKRLNNLGEVLRAKGAFSEAEDLYRQAMEIDAVTVGKNHPSHSTHLSNLGEALMAQGQFSEAEAVLLEALEIKAATLGKAHPYYAHVLHNLGELYAGLGRWQDAGTYMGEALDIREAILGKDHPDSVKSRGRLDAFRQRL